MYVYEIFVLVKEENDETERNKCRRSLTEDVVFFYFLEYIYYLPTTHGAVRCESYKNHNAISDDQDHRPYLRYIMSTMFTEQ